MRKTSSKKRKLTFKNKQTENHTGTSWSNRTDEYLKVKFFVANFNLMQLIAISRRDVMILSIRFSH